MSSITNDHTTQSSEIYASNSIPEAHRIYDSEHDTITSYAANKLTWLNDGVSFCEWLTIALNEIVCSHGTDESVNRGRFMTTHSALFSHGKHEQSCRPAMLWHPHKPSSDERTHFLSAPLSRRYALSNATDMTMVHGLSVIGNHNNGTWPMIPIYVPISEPRLGPEEASVRKQWSFDMVSPRGLVVFAIDQEYVVTSFAALEERVGLLSLMKTAKEHQEEYSGGCGVSRSCGSLGQLQSKKRWMVLGAQRFSLSGALLSRLSEATCAKLFR